MQLRATRLTSIAHAVRNLFAGASLDLNFAKTNVLDSRITFTRASTATRVNASGVLESIAIDGPRFDYDPVTLAPKGLLIEEQRTNLLTYSSEFDNAAWGKNNATVTANAATAPDGTATADYAVRASTVASVTIQRTSLGITGVQTYTASIYAKVAVTGNNLGLRLQGTFPSRADVVVNLLTGAVVFSGGVNFTLVGAAVANAGGGWYRISITATSDSTGIDRFITGPTAVANGAWESSSTTLSDAYLWGAQLEAGAFPTSYIPTTTAAATRAAAVAVMTGANFSNWYRQDEGTLFAEFINGIPGGASGPTQAAGVWTAADASLGAAFNGYGLRISATSSTATAFQFTARSGATTLNAQSAASGFIDVGVTYKTASAWSAANMALAKAGTAGVSVANTVAPLLTVHNILYLGTQTTGGSPPYALNGHIRRISYFPRRLSNSELEGITK